MAKIDLGKLNIDGIVKETIRRFINENLSISDEVLKTTNDIYFTLSYGINHFNYVLFDIGEFYVDAENIIVNNPNVELQCSTDLKNRVLKLQVPYYSRKILEVPLKKAIQHEIEHIYQASKTIKYKNPSYDDIYDIAIGTFSDKNASRFDINLAQFIYCCSNKEQDAFINELYQEICHGVVDLKSDKYDMEIIKNSEIYKCLRIIKDMVEFLKEELRYTTYNDNIKKYGKSKLWLISLGQNASKRIEDKIRKVLAKAREDRMKNTLSPKVPLNNDNNWAEDKMYNNN